QVHDAAEKIRYRCDGQYFQAALNDFRLCRIDLKKLSSENVGPDSHERGYADCQNDAVQKNPVHPFLLTDTVVLACKAHACLGYCIDCGIQKSDDVVCRRVPCHGSGSE